MKRKCEYCGEQFTPKKYKKQNLNQRFVEDFGPALSCAFMANVLTESFCDNKECQDRAQYEADMFDMHRKGEY